MVIAVVGSGLKWEASEVKTIYHYINVLCVIFIRPFVILVFEIN